MPEGTITLNQAGKVEVYAMQASDELLLTSPDALMSGVAVEKIIESCVPSITNAAMVSAPDLDALIIAIRAASNGTNMEMSVPCPSCKEVNEIVCDLSAILATAQEVPEVLEVRLNDDIVISLKPHCVGDQTRMMLAAYNENRKISILESEDLSEEKRRNILIDTVETLRGFQTSSILSSISKVTIPETSVDDKQMIKEFLENSAPQHLKLIKDEVEKINSMGVDKNIHVTCAKCNHQWDTNLEFNPSTFFGQGSSK